MCVRACVCVHVCVCASVCVCVCVCVQGEAEVRSDGTHMTVKPSQLSVARITLVRGWGYTHHPRCVGSEFVLQEATRRGLSFH